MNALWRKCCAVQECEGADNDGMSDDKSGDEGTQTDDDGAKKLLLEEGTGGKRKLASERSASSLVGAVGSESELALVTSKVEAVDSIVPAPPLEPPTASITPPPPPPPLEE